MWKECSRTFVGAVSLFGEKTLYIIDTLSGKTEMYDALIENLEAFASSDNTFVVIEGALLAPQKKKFQKHAETMEEYKAVATELFNVFSMADSLARKDKKNPLAPVARCKTYRSKDGSNYRDTLVAT